MEKCDLKGGLNVCGLYKYHKEFQIWGVLVSNFSGTIPSEITSDFFKSLRRSVILFSTLMIKFNCLSSLPKLEKIY